MTESNEKSLVTYTDAEKGASVGDLKDKYILLVEERDLLRKQNDAYKEQNGTLERLNEAYKEQNELLKDCLRDLKSLLEGKIKEN